MAIDPSTGFIRALVGGKDWDTQKTNLATGEGTNGGRPCGSSFKTFTLIAALEEGIDPQTMVDCSSPSVIPDTGYDSSNPLQNINNINYGTRSIARAFAVSSNTGFVRLQMALGTQKVIDAANKMGITSALNANPSLTLGQSNVTMLDMADAYACIANGGTKYDAQPILKIYDKNNNLIVDNSHPSGTQVISAEVAHAATEVKTGTSSEYHDITFCGITPQMSVAIWFGDPSNQETIPTDVSAADVFKKFMTAALYGKQTETFPQASNPTYKAFSNATYHIGTTSSSSSSNSANSAGNSSNNQYGNSTGLSNGQSDTASGSGNSNSYGTGNANGNASGSTGSGNGSATGGGTTGGATGGGTGAATGGTTGGGGTGSATGGGTVSGGASAGGGAATQ